MGRWFRRRRRTSPFIPRGLSDWCGVLYHRAEIDELRSGGPISRSTWPTEACNRSVVTVTPPGSTARSRTTTSWCAQITTAWTAFHLHPPVAFALDNTEQRYRCMLPFGSGACDLALDGAPLLRRRLRAGSMTFVEPGVRVTMKSVEPVEFLLLSIDPDHVRLLADAAAGGRAWYARTLHDHHDPALMALGSEVRRTLLSDALPLQAYLQSLADAVTLRLLCHFLGEIVSAGPSETLSPALLGRIVRHIDAHLGERLSVSKLAEMAKLTRSHFSRAFQRMTGDPPQRFILKRRVCRARDLLSSNVGTLAEVAAQTGFSSQAHLSTGFRKEVGTTPAQYRAAFRPRGHEASEATAA
jgi:AraC family transcriptional regulator